MISSFSIKRDRLLPKIQLTKEDCGVFNPKDVVAGLKDRIAYSPCPVLADDNPGVFGEVIGYITDAWMENDKAWVKVERNK